MEFIMLKTVRSALVCAALFALCAPGLMGQADGKRDAQSKKEKLWVMTYSGGGG